MLNILSVILVAAAAAGSLLCPEFQSAAVLADGTSGCVENPPRAVFATQLRLPADAIGAGAVERVAEICTAAAAYTLSGPDVPESVRYRPGKRYAGWFGNSTHYPANYFLYAEHHYANRLGRPVFRSFSEMLAGAPMLNPITQDENNANSTLDPTDYWTGVDRTGMPVLDANGVPATCGDWSTVPLYGDKSCAYGVNDPAGGGAWAHFGVADGRTHKGFLCFEQSDAVPPAVRAAVCAACLPWQTCLWHLADDSYSCGCAPWQTGFNCDVNVRQCLPGRCANGGVCRDYVGAATCDCPDGWVGARCEEKVDPFALQSCGAPSLTSWCGPPAGRCVVTTSAAYGCLCNPASGFYGSQCTTCPGAVCRDTDPFKCTRPVTDEHCGFCGRACPPDKTCALSAHGASAECVPIRCSGCESPNVCVVVNRIAICQTAPVCDLVCDDPTYHCIFDAEGLKRCAPISPPPVCDLVCDDPTYQCIFDAEGSKRCAPISPPPVCDLVCDDPTYQCIFDAEGLKRCAPITPPPAGTVCDLVCEDPTYICKYDAAGLKRCEPIFQPPTGPVCDLYCDDPTYHCVFDAEGQKSCVPINPLPPPTGPVCDLICDGTHICQFDAEGRKSCVPIFPPPPPFGPVCDPPCEAGFGCAFVNGVPTCDAPQPVCDPPCEAGFGCAFVNGVPTCDAPQPVCDPPCETGTSCAWVDNAGAQAGTQAGTQAAACV